MILLLVLLLVAAIAYLIYLMLANDGGKEVKEVPVPDPVPVTEPTVPEPITEPPKPTPTGPEIPDELDISMVITYDFSRSWFRKLNPGTWFEERTPIPDKLRPPRGGAQFDGGHEYACDAWGFSDNMTLFRTAVNATCNMDTGPCNFVLSSERKQKVVDLFAVLDREQDKFFETETGKNMKIVHHQFTFTFKKSEQKAGCLSPWVDMRNWGLRLGNQFRFWSNPSHSDKPCYVGPSILGYIAAVRYQVYDNQSCKLWEFYKRVCDV